MATWQGQYLNRYDYNKNSSNHNSPKAGVPNSRAAAQYRAMAHLEPGRKWRESAHTTPLVQAAGEHAYEQSSICVSDGRVCLLLVQMELHMHTCPTPSWNHPLPPPGGPQSRNGCGSLPLKDYVKISCGINCGI